MREDGSGAMHDDARVEPSLADLILPDRFACLRFNCMDHAIAGSLNEQARSVDVDDNRRRICGVVRPASRSADVNSLAGLLVEGHEAVRAASVLTPLECYGAHDHEITINNRRDCTTAMRGQQSKVFG